MRRVAQFRLLAAAAVEGSEEQRLAAFREVRDEIRMYLRTFPRIH